MAKFKTLKPELMRMAIRMRNVNKHLRLANATNGLESIKHTERALKLMERYGMTNIKI